MQVPFLSYWENEITADFLDSAVPISDDELEESETEIPATGPNLKTPNTNHPADHDAENNEEDEDNDDDEEG